MVKYRQGILILTEAEDGENPRSILADRASHIIPPTHHIANRHQIRQDAKPNWQWQPKPSPIQNTLFRLHLEKAIKAWVKKLTNVRSGEMGWTDRFPYHRAVNSDTAQGINNVSSVATHAWWGRGYTCLQNIHHMAWQTYALYSLFILFQQQIGT